MIYPIVTYAQKIVKYRRAQTIRQIELAKERKIKGEKICYMCKQLRLLNQFYERPGNMDGKGGWCKECVSKYYINRNRKDSILLKMEFVIAYGGACTCCGESNINLLTVEHIRGKGHKLVREGNTINTLRKLKKLNWPASCTVLCWNCNSSSRDMPCSHTEEYKIYEEKLNKSFDGDYRKKKYYELKEIIKVNNKIMKEFLLFRELKSWKQLITQ